MNYSEEEKKAIEYWKRDIKFYHYNTQLASEHYAQILLNLIQKQDKIIDKMVEHLADVIKNDDNASLLPFDDYEDNLEEKVKEYFKKVGDENVKD